MLRDPGQHPRADLYTIVKCPNVLASLGMLQNDMRAPLRFDPVSFSEKRRPEFIPMRSGQSASNFSALHPSSVHLGRALNKFAPGTSNYQPEVDKAIAKLYGARNCCVSIPQKLQLKRC